MAGSRNSALRGVVGQFGVAQRVFSDTLQADANGNFASRGATRRPGVFDSTRPN